VWGKETLYTENEAVIFNEPKNKIKKNEVRSKGRGEEKERRNYKERMRGIKNKRISNVHHHIFIEQIYNSSTSVDCRILVRGQTYLKNEYFRNAVSANKVLLCTVMTLNNDIRHYYYSLFGLTFLRSPLALITLQCTQ
jgi:hypothetical protein